MIQLKRAYEPKARGDGFRILVDRLWPRGLKKEDLSVDAWAKEIAPSSSLRRSFAHDLKRWPEFQSQYGRELRSESARRCLDKIARQARLRNVTLLFSAKDEKHNNAVILKRALVRRMHRLS